MIKVIDSRNGKELADDVIEARGIKSKLLGLIGRDSLEQACAMLIPGCRQVHTFFMRFAIDVLFLNSARKVIGMECEMAPFRISRFYLKGKSVLEMPAGTLKRMGVRLGDTLWIGEGSAE
jgi:hypothetical protein